MSKFMKQIKKFNRKQIISWITMLLPVVIILFSNCFIMKIFMVDGNSMYPTLPTNKIVLVSLISNSYSNGDIVLIDIDGIYMVKRIIAGGGQEIKIDRNEKSVYVDKVLIDEEYVYYSDADFSPVTDENIEKYSVPHQCIFVMGDNRDISLDSRDSSIGYISLDSIVGKIVTINNEQ